MEVCKPIDDGRKQGEHGMEKIDTQNNKFKYIIKKTSSRLKRN